MAAKERWVQTWVPKATASQASHLVGQFDPGLFQPA